MKNWSKSNSTFTTLILIKKWSKYDWFYLFMIAINSTTAWLFRLNLVNFRQISFICDDFSLFLFSYFNLFCLFIFSIFYCVWTINCFCTFSEVFYLLVLVNCISLVSNQNLNNPRTYVGSVLLDWSGLNWIELKRPELKWNE